MIWKWIGQSVIGSSHVQSGKTCEDAMHSRIIQWSDKEEALVCFISDGAGSAAFAAKASETSVQLAVQKAVEMVDNGIALDDQSLLQLAEEVYDALLEMATAAQVPKNEFSCTLLGCILLPGRTGFLQIGDGAIIRNDGTGYFTPVFWPDNGEYQNTTTFLIDDPNLPHLKTKIIEEAISEVGLFTDGLQMLTLNNETKTVHQPFFSNLFQWLRKATETEHIAVLNQKLTDYLSGDIINKRTDDDKTLVLATRLT
jgi:hypothetical protein